MSQMVVATVVMIVLAGAAVYAVSRSRMNPGKSESPHSGRRSNVISMESHRRAKQNAADQICSSCRKKNGKLIFMRRMMEVSSDSARIARPRRRNGICCRYECYEKYMLQMLVFCVNITSVVWNTVVLCG